MYTFFYSYDTLVVYFQTTKTGGDCIFKELADNGMYKYQSVSHPNWYLGFKHNGKKLKGDLYTKKPRMGTCYFFTKPPIRSGSDRRDPYAPKVDFDSFVPHRRGRHQHRPSNGSPQHRHPHTRYQGYSPNSNNKYAPKIDLSKITIPKLQRLRRRKKS